MTDWIQPPPPPSSAPVFLNDDPYAVEWAKAIFEYDPLTGLLLARQVQPDLWNLQARILTRYTRHGLGAGRIHGLGVGSASNRVVWFLHHGEYPKGNLRHKDGDVTNDRIENLELARAPRIVLEPLPRGRPRFRPIGVARLHDRWQAYVNLETGRRKNLGVFKTEQEAVAARKRWDEGADLV